MIEYLDNIYSRLLEHRYRYYVLDSNVISDYEYDWIEKYYNNLATEHNHKIMRMVDFDFKDPEAIEAGKRVDNGTDYYSLWEKEMLPIWFKLGYPKYLREK